MLQRFSIGGWFLPAAIVTAALAVPALHAQMHKVAPPEKVTRAIAVYEWTGDLAKPTAARIVPVTLFINGHLEDAGVYLTRPMPFALQSGDVYSIEQAGKAQGTIDIDYARNILPPGSTADVAAVGAWYGYGKYAPLPPPAKPKPLKPSVHIASIDGGSADDDRPRFVGKQPNQSPTDDSTPAKPTTTASSTTPADDPDRPHMNRRPGSSSDDSSTSTTTASTDTGTVPDSDPDRPTLRHRDPTPDTPEKKRSKNSDSAVIPMATSLNDDPDRPSMRRGKPAGLTTSPELVTLPPDLHQIAAVSDAVNRDPHIFAREWSTPTDRTETLTQLETLAQPRVAQYLTTYHLTPPALNTTGPSTTTTPGTTTTRGTTTPSATSKPTNHRKPIVQSAPPPQLLEEQLTPYTLSYGGLPTFVYTAQSPITTGGPVYITLVAQRLPSGELQTSFSSVTDASHLDRTPWFRLVDAVDPDASHRASLLFELRAQTTRQFALYRLITAHAEQQFITGTIQ